MSQVVPNHLFDLMFQLISTCLVGSLNCICNEQINLVFWLMAFTVDCDSCYVHHSCHPPVWKHVHQSTPGYLTHAWFLKFHLTSSGLRVEFLLKTDSWYLKDTGVNKPWQPLGIPFAITQIGQLHKSPLGPSPIPRDLGRGHNHQSTCSNIETRVDRLRSEVRVIRGVV